MVPVALKMYKKSSPPRFRFWKLAPLIIASVLSYTTVASASQATFAWDANTEPALAGYKIYYKTGSPGPPYNGVGAVEGDSPIIIELDPNGDGDTSDGDLSDPAFPEYTIHGLSDTETTFSVVTAYSVDDESGYSNEVSYNSPGITPVASVPFVEDFESGTLAGWWMVNSTGAGRVEVTAAYGPYQGTYHLTMDNGQPGGYSLNELILTLDLTGQSGVMLGFYHKEYSDEDHIMPDSFTGSHHSDGVAISADGTTWYKVQGLTDVDGTSLEWQRFEVDLDAAVAAAGISYTNGFKIKFQQCDNYFIAYDGFAFDDIEVY